METEQGLGKKAPPETAEQAMIRHSDAISRMIWEGGPLPEPFVKNSRHPERVMIEAPEATSGIGEVQNPTG